MNAGVYLSLGGVALSAVALVCNSRRYRPGMIAHLPDSDLIKHGLWDECDGEPMNEYAEEYERRHGIGAQQAKGEKK